MAAPFVLVMVVMCVALTKDVRDDPLVRRGQLGTRAIEQAVEFGTQTYGDRFYLPVKPHPAGKAGDNSEASVARPDQEQPGGRVPPQPSREETSESSMGPTKLVD
jgi:hypothetical protein